MTRLRMWLLDLKMWFFSLRPVEQYHYRHLTKHLDLRVEEPPPTLVLGQVSRPPDPDSAKGSHFVMQDFDLSNVVGKALLGLTDAKKLVSRVRLTAIYEDGFEQVVYERPGRLRIFVEPMDLDTDIVRVSASCINEDGRLSEFLAWARALPVRDQILHIERGSDFLTLRCDGRVLSTPEDCFWRVWKPANDTLRVQGDIGMPTGSSASSQTVERPL